MNRRKYLVTCGLFTVGSLSGCMRGPFGSDGTEASPAGRSARTPEDSTNDTDPAETTSAGADRSSGTDGTDAAGRTEDTETDGDRAFPNRLRIVHTGGRRVFYEVAVSGRLAHAWGSDASEPVGYQDAIHDGRTRLSGSVNEGEDRFDFRGEVVTLAIDGPAVASVDGERIPSDRDGLGGSLPGDAVGTATRSTATAAEVTGIDVRGLDYRAFPDRRDVVAVTLENVSGSAIDRAAIYVAFYDRDEEYRFGTNAYPISDLAPGATVEVTPERPFEDVSVVGYQVFVASMRHDDWVPGTDLASL